MDRFFVGESADGSVELPEAEAHHARNVLRKKVGDEVEVFDGTGRSASGRFEVIERRRAVVTVGEWRSDPEPARRVTIATAFPKGERAKFLVEKATELGVDRLIPLHTTNSVVAPRDSKLERFRQTVVAACKQCRRNRLMTIDEPRKWGDFIAGTPEGLLVAHPPQDGRDEVQSEGLAGDVTIAVGPEGGFTTLELEEAADAGATPLTLGRHVLRIETAVLAAAVRFVRASPSDGHG